MVEISLGTTQDWRHEGHGVVFTCEQIINYEVHSLKPSLNGVAPRRAE